MQPFTHKITKTKQTNITKKNKRKRRREGRGATL
jgi:hypothetical protein